jgi:MFS family permease
MAGIQILGCYTFAANREVRNAKIEASKRRMGGILKSRIVLSNVAMGLLLVGSFAGAEVGTVAVITDRNVSGWVLAALSAGGLVGGFLFGHRAKTKYALTKFFALTTTGYSLIFFAPHEPIWVAICWFIAGLGIAPIFATLGSIIAIKLSPSESVEAYGWISTGQLIGFSSAAAIAGIAVDTIDPVAAFGVAVATGVLGLTVALVSLPFTPTPPSTNKADH